MTYRVYRVGQELRTVALLDLRRFALEDTLGALNQRTGWCLAYEPWTLGCRASLAWARLQPALARIGAILLVALVVYALLAISGSDHPGAVPGR